MISSISMNEKKSDIKVKLNFLMTSLHPWKLEDGSLRAGSMKVSYFFTLM